MDNADLRPGLDTSDMVGLHQVFRDALGDAARLVGQVTEADLERAERAGSYYTNVLALLQVHHEGEDELLTPKLLQRAPQQADVITRIAGQHSDVVDAIEKAQQSITAWRADPSTRRREEATARLDELNRLLAPHLDDEERDILPIAAQHLSAAEWGQLAEHGMARFTGDKPWLILGLIQEQMTPTQRAAMDAHMPAPMAQFWTSTGRDLAATYLADLRREHPFTIVPT